MDKKTRSGSGMNIPDHISERLETNFWVSILRFFDADANPSLGSRNLFDPGYGIRGGINSDPCIGINIPDPQHCVFVQVHRKHIPDSG
jgi:hypothetical protein